MPGGIDRADLRDVALAQDDRGRRRNRVSAGGSDAHQQRDDASIAAGRQMIPSVISHFSTSWGHSVIGSLVGRSPNA